MKRKMVLVSILATLTLFVPVAIVSQAQKPVAIVAPVSVPLNADVIFAKVNDQRMQNGLKPLVRDARLDASAQLKANDMATGNYFAHINPSTGKNGYTYAIDTSGQFCSYVSENLGDITHPEPDLNISMVSSWMGSKPHYDAILDDRYTITGVAISGTKVVQHFCIVN